MTKTKDFKRLFEIKRIILFSFKIRIYGISFVNMLPGAGINDEEKPIMI